MLLTLALAMAISGLSHAAEELAENVVHVADTGHGAHADEHPEGGAQLGSEHFCFGAVHNCGCCPTGVAAATAACAAPARPCQRVSRTALDDGFEQDGMRSRIERPPRA